jgi:AcrR family transcriptional regulator
MPAIQLSLLASDDAVSSGDPKRVRILEAALKVFLAYGFQRVTMEDIAKAAEISRPALYLQFKNKGAIYRSIAAGVFNHSRKAARLALASGAPLSERLADTIAASIIGVMREIAGAPHGAELLDVKNSLAADLAQEWRQDMHDLLAAAIKDDAEAHGADLAARGFSAEGLADLLLDGLEGLKARGAGPDELQAGLGRLVRLIDLVLRP